MGKVFIITNASDGWVQHSSAWCLPGLAPYLEQVDIISARAGFEASFPGDSHAWKMHAFLQVQNKLQLEAVTDAGDEQRAGPRATAGRWSHGRPKARSLSCPAASRLASGGKRRPGPPAHHSWRVAIARPRSPSQVTNLVSVGDSHIEMDAVHLLGRSFAHALVKTVKLWERPTPYELQKQLEVVRDKLPDIYSTATTLNIWLERETAQAS